MFMRNVNEPKGAGHFLSGPINTSRANEQIELAATNVELPSGTVLGRVTRGLQSVNAALGGGNTGNGVFAGNVTADPGVPAGVYTLTVIEPAANGGVLRVERPDGTQDGIARIGVAYNGSVNFTLADGATNFVSGDTATITVSYAPGNGRYKLIDPAATDGTQNFAGILWDRRPASAGVQRAAATTREATVNGHLLTYPAGISDADRAAIEAQAEAVGVLIHR